VALVEAEAALVLPDLEVAVGRAAALRSVRAALSSYQQQDRQCDVEPQLSAYASVHLVSRAGWMA
jgi:hypothetical protein